LFQLNTIVKRYARVNLHVINVVQQYSFIVKFESKRKIEKRRVSLKMVYVDTKKDGCLD
jgi:ribosomal protein S8